LTDYYFSLGPTLPRSGWRLATKFTNQIIARTNRYNAIVSVNVAALQKLRYDISRATSNVLMAMNENSNYRILSLINAYGAGYFNLEIYDRSYWK